MKWLSGLLALVAPSVSRAGSVGVGAGVAVDLPDVKASAMEAEFGLAPNLLLPIRLDVAPAAMIRATVHAAFGQGRDVVSWQNPGVDRVGEHTNKAWVGTVAATIGPEVHVPLEGTVEPYLAGGAGVALVHVWHNSERADLFDPVRYPEERLDNGLTIDPFTRQPVFATDLALGAELGRFWFEAGYAVQFVSSAPMVGAAAELEVRREAFGWNTVRLVAGFSIPVAGDR